jgi:hypothetical protein
MTVDTVTPAEPRAEADLTWSTPAPALVAVLIGGVALLSAAVLVDNEPAGRLFVGVAGIGMLVIGAIGLRQRPRLAIVAGPPAELIVRRLRGVLTYRADSIDRARVVRYPRLGRRVPMLELEVLAPPNPHDPGSPETRLLLFGRWDLGTAPEDVLDALYEHGLARAE